jgi:ABC-type antimicrobial peptide transport system permease subunit
MLASFFGVLASVLVAIGLCGVVGHSAARRTSEIGLRLALGATGPKVVWLLVREAALLSTSGIAVGIPALLLTGKYARSMLYGLKPSEPFTLTATILAMLVITAIAALLPALRASRVDAMWALRYE